MPGSQCTSALILPVPGRRSSSEHDILLAHRELYIPKASFSPRPSRFGGPKPSVRPPATRRVSRSRPVFLSALSVRKVRGIFSHGAHGDHGEEQRGRRGLSRRPSAWRNGFRPPGGRRLPGSVPLPWRPRAAPLLRKHSWFSLCVLCALCEKSPGDFLSPVLPACSARSVRNGPGDFSRGLVLVGAQGGLRFSGHCLGRRASLSWRRHGYARNDRKPSGGACPRR
jgi:hypothetical protein